MLQIIKNNESFNEKTVNRTSGCKKLIKIKKKEKSSRKQKS